MACKVNAPLLAERLRAELGRVVRVHDELVVERVLVVARREIVVVARAKHRRHVEREGVVPVTWPEVHRSL